ncbi:MAG: bifunctional DNA-formamidopyrimidine glycosylase/DNA-(apurinic or apyrimidinic site) lyase [Myxococcota bacterium]
MPELPEVETVRRHLAACLPDQRIVGVDLRREDLRYPIPVREVQALVGATLHDVRRRAKYLLLDAKLPRGLPRVVLVHLGMSGRLFHEVGEPPEWRLHEHFRFRLTGDHGPSVLRYVDPRRFGALDVMLARDEPTHPLLASLGPEPLDDLTAAGLAQQAQTCRIAVKAFLMDSQRVVGVGNIYASEACFHAGVHPLRPACSLSLAEWQRLVVGVREVLLAAIRAGGSTLRDFVGGDSMPGSYQQEFAVYGQAGAPCRRCPPRNHAVVERVVLGTRATYFCGGCQK